MKHKSKIVVFAGVFIFLALVVFGTAMAKKYNSGKAWIGVYTQTIDSDLEEAFDLATDEGVVIVDIADDSPAEDAGLRRKDIILKFNGHDIEKAGDLSDYVRDMDAGDEAEIVVLRKGEEKTIKIEIGERPDFEWFDSKSGHSFTVPKSFSRTYSFSSSSHGYMGVAIQDLNDQLGEYFGVENGEGVLITEVYEDTPAEEAGLKAGDVIVSVDGEEVAETEDLQDIISEKEEGDEVEVVYLRKGNRESAKVEVTEESFGMNNFSVPNFNIQIPNLSGLKNLDHFYFGDDDEDHEYFDVQEYKKEMEELRQELKEMSRELQDIRKKLE